MTSGRGASCCTKEAPAQMAVVKPCTGSSCGACGMHVLMVMRGCLLIGFAGWQVRRMCKALAWSRSASLITAVEIKGYHI